MCASKRRTAPERLERLLGQKRPPFEWVLYPLIYVYIYIYIYIYIHKSIVFFERGRERDRETERQRLETVVNLRI